MCGLMGSVSARLRGLRRAPDHLPGGLTRQAGAAGSEEDGRRAGPPGRQGRSAAGEVRIQRLEREPPDRYHPLLVTLAPQERRALLAVHVIEVQTGRLGDPGTDPVEQLEERAVAQRPLRGVPSGAGPTCRLQQRLDLVDGQGVRQAGGQ